MWCRCDVNVGVVLCKCALMNQKINKAVVVAVHTKHFQVTSELGWTSFKWVLSGNDVVWGVTVLYHSPP